MATAKKAAKAATPARKTTAKPVPAKSAVPVKPPVRKAVAPKPAVKAAAAPKAVAPAKPAPALKSAPAAVPAKADKVEKAKKPKLVRDSFTIPKAEYTVLDELKQRATKAGAAVKKSELLRAGIKALAALDDAKLLAALAAVPAIKTGRPAKD